MNTTNTTHIFQDYHVASKRAMFFLQLPLEIQAMALYILIFVFIAGHRNILRTPQNQSIFILLIPNFLHTLFGMPETLHYLRLNFVSPATPAYCIFWTFVEFALDGVSEFLMATISLQRHMLIFNSHVLRVRRKRILLFYLPLFFCIIYPTIFDFAIVVLYPCDGIQWEDYTSDQCGTIRCYFYNPILAMYDWIFNCGMPTVVNLISDIILFIRVLLQKRRVHQEVTWKQQRRMAFQLFTISGLYVISWIPVVTVGTMQTLDDSSILDNIQNNYFTCLPSLVWFFLPWIVIGLWPELREWMIKPLKRRTAVVSTVTASALRQIRRSEVAQEHVDEVKRDGFVSRPSFAHLYVSFVYSIVPTIP